MQADRKSKPTCFDWIQLLLTFCVPVAIVVYTILENNRDLAISTQHRNQDLSIADGQQQDTVLREYKKTLSRLVEKYGLFFNYSSTASLIARSSTTVALNQIDPARRKFLLSLLYDAKLITYDLPTDPSAISLDYANFTDICLFIKFINPVYVHLNVEGAIMIRADFRNVTLHGAKFNKAVLHYADFSFTNNVKFYDVLGFNGSNDITLFFRNSDLTSAKFLHVKYEHATFEQALLRNADMKSFACVSCNFSLSFVERTNLINAVIEDSLMDFVDLSDSNLYRSRFGKNIDFHSTILFRVNGTYTSFTHCQFTSTAFGSAIFDYTKMEDCTFFNANFLEASIQYGVFTRANFTQANLFASDWRNVRCEKCIFHQTNFTDANLLNAVFIDSDFQGAFITTEQLRQTASLKGSILPNGTLVN
ncbi:unnamed protein product [Adineta ricciae]|uniref:Pentapeptide repeat-containing protein n=1 Tax=Adineta ricciae TaxID=249248 RepID=A0A814Y3Q4_ADIRI|nr:unnamed protein product [Adineta ricciae]